MVIPARSEKGEMRSFPSTPERQPSDTATLSCSECGHDGRINGDWLIHVLADSLTYECPQCEMAINSRQQRRELVELSAGSLRFERKT